MENDIAGSYGNQILYNMCAERPMHTHLDTIASKVWLIGRSYAAAIERGAGKQIEEGEDFYMKKVAPAILASPIDEWIASVRNIERLTSENIIDSLHCHKKVMDLFTNIAGGTTKRSLASKYLHFHAPNAFFIYDSRANHQVRQRLHDRKKHRDQSNPDCDEEYQIFCAKCLRCRDELEKKMGRLITPRELDSELLNFQY
jgi:hypothetical protein